MFALFRFEGRIGQLPYSGWSLIAFVIQHAVVWIFSGHIPELAWSFRVLPPSWLVGFDPSQRATFLPVLILFFLSLAVWVIAAWALAALAFRRAVDAHLPEPLAILAVAPVVQIPVILFLCFAPARPATEQAQRRDPMTTETAWRTAVEGALAGIGLTLASVAISALVFRVYATGLFVISPMVIGATTAYLANRRGDVGARRTFLTVLGATALGGAALLAAALEGLVCIMLAAPLAFGAALIGGVLGRSIALANRRSVGRTLSSVAVMPLVFVSEAAMPPESSFESYQALNIGAPPEIVWDAIVHMTPLDEAVALPFQLGLAYPLRAEIIGEGVGGLRRGVFSTGVATERITEWVPNRKLTVVVENDPPAMRELSPYHHVYSPHVVGYFHTRAMTFQLAAGSEGHTILIERTSHELQLAPVLYWLPMAQWVVGEDNARVLEHIKRDAERVAHDSGAAAHREDPSSLSAGGE
jgi:uncharacterized membrane protein YhaH (DUF805 family)